MIYPEKTFMSYGNPDSGLCNGIERYLLSYAIDLDDAIHKFLRNERRQL
jgi:hypothetical protein